MIYSMFTYSYMMNDTENSMKNITYPTCVGLLMFIDSKIIYIRIKVEHLII